ncbi:hypothetical protein EMGBS10_14820 [Opitutia bacterium]|nr:hypothetical protein EMGBS10_14820 [Opitutae bacterium]
MFADDDRTVGGQGASGGHPGQAEVGQPSAVVPVQGHALGRGERGRGEGPPDRFLFAPGLGVHAGGVRLRIDRRPQLQGREDRVEQVAAEVAQRAAAEVQPIAPVERVVDRGRVGSGRRRAQPEVPGQTRRHRARRRACRELRVAVALVGQPGMRRAHLADAPLLDQPHRRPIFRAGMDLVAHLRADPVPGRLQPEQARLLDRVGQRLLQVDVLLQPHRQERRQGVHVVGRRDDRRVEPVAQLREHRAEVRVVRHARESRVGVAEASGVDVAEADVFHGGVGADLLDVIEALAVATDRHDLQAGVEVAGAEQGGEAEGGDRGGREEATAGEAHGVATRWRSGCSPQPGMVRGRTAGGLRCALRGPRGPPRPSLRETSPTTGASGQARACRAGHSGKGSRSRASGRRWSPS